MLAQALALGMALALALALILAVVGLASAQAPNPSGLPPALRQVAFDPPLGASVPLDLEFRNEDGRAVRLGDYVTDKPVILAFVYYDCPMLCNQVLEALSSSLRVLSFEAGKQIEVVAVSFDPQETPAMAHAKKEDTLERHRHSRTEAGWHFLTGEEPSIAALTEAVGFRYTYDPRAKLFAHASRILILTPQGRISRYLPGIEYAPRDLRLGLVEASANQIATAVDRLLLFCYEYDPATGQYGAAVLRLVRWGGILTFVGVVISILLFRRRERQALPVVSVQGDQPC